MQKFFFRIVIIILSIFPIYALATLVLPPPAAARFPSSRARWYPTVRADTVKTHTDIALKESHPEGFYYHRFLPDMKTGIEKNPYAHALPPSIKTLSLQEAILLALRNNPSVKSSELQRIIDKYDLYIAFQASRLQWQSVDFSSTLQNHAAPGWDLNGGFSVHAPSGTTVSISHDNNLLGGLGSNKIEIKQELLRGFGLQLGRIPYQNALDAERVNRLNFKNAVIIVVDAVITAYYNLVQGYNTLATTEQTYENQKQTVWEAKLRYKAGKISKGDYNTQKTQLATYQLTLVQEKDALRDQYQDFLKAIGLVPSTQIQIDQTIPKEPIALPSKKTCIALALKNNIGYLTDIYKLREDKRALIQAKDKRKWKLTMTADVTLGTERSAVGAPLNSLNTNPTLGFDLSIPIDDVSAKKGVVQAQINIENDQRNLEQKKEDVIRNVMNQYDSITNQYQQVVIAKEQVAGQQQTVDDAKLRLKYGQSSVFEVNTEEQELLSSKVGLITAKIGYLTDIETLNSTLGITLERWHIKLRY